MDCVVLGVAESDFHFKVCIQHLDPFIIKWTSSVLPCLGYCKQCCHDYWGACIFSTWSFLWIFLRRSRIAGSYGNSVFHFFF